MIHAARLHPLDSLPASAKQRICRGLTLLADAAWYRRALALPAESVVFALRISELAVAGLTSADCQWLLLAGYIELRRPNGQRCAKNVGMHARRYVQGRTLVMLTHRGELEMLRLRRDGELMPEQGAGSLLVRRNGAAGPIRYHAESRELYLGKDLVLRLPSIAQKQHGILTSFHAHHWTRSISCPFADSSSGGRAQRVRDAVHGLNAGQRPLRIQFHSAQKGQRIWHELVESERQYERPRAAFA